MKDLILTAARNIFDIAYEEGGFVFVLFTMQDNNYQCVFHVADGVFHVRLVPLWGVAPLIVPEARRDALLKYFEAINSVSKISEGWLRLHDGSEICCQNETAIGPSVETLVPILPGTVHKAGETLARWWPGMVAVINSGMDPTAAFQATHNVS